MSNQYEQERQNKAEAIRALGLDPYGVDADTDWSSGEDFQPACNLAWTCLIVDNLKIVPDFTKTAENGELGYGCGRIVLRREMGNLHFLTVRDETGDIQVALSKKRLSEQKWKLAKLLDLGDLIYFTGRCAPTKTGEPTVWADTLGIGAKAISPPPDKQVGLVDVELRYRRRATDLWSNPKVMTRMQARSAIIHTIRKYLHDMGFIEVETPILQTIPGGAAAKPFVTHHNALDIPLFMRIAPELYLKRLLVGGFPRIFEIGRNFRNEGISTKHNPEFTALELYHSYSDYERIADLVEQIIQEIFNSVINLNVKAVLPWRRVKMVDLTKEWMTANSWTLPTGGDEPSYYFDFYQKHVEPTLIEPTFVTHLPAAAVPLAKSDGQGYALAFELVINGQEIGCGYSELNNPIEQLERLRKQLGEGDEAQKIDADFIEALNVGMPPAGGLGIGIDRLVMWLLGAETIRDVILFPTMKPQKE